VKLVFDLDFDGSTWPGPLADQEASAGEAWVGNRGLVDILETTLGLGGPELSATERAAALVPAALSTSGFWSRSAESDPMGTARTLLHWRDSLWLCGWRGQQLTPRLRDLAIVTSGVFPGMPDRMAAIADALGHRPTDCGIEEITRLEPAAGVPLSLSDVFAALEKAGTRMTTLALPPARATGDLAAARKKVFSPRSDDSIQLLRPAGPLAATEEVAA